MNRILILITGFLFSYTIIYGQQPNYEGKISSQDNVLLNVFWTKFKTAVNTNDKVMLSTLCEFPFYCHPCIDDTTLKNNNHITIKVTRKLFNKSQYKLFFDRPLKDVVEKYKDFATYIFHHSFYDKGGPKGFMFSYTIVAPSKTWEGSQGFIYLEKINGKYKITGIDTVP